MVSIITTSKVIHIIFMSKLLALNQEHQDLRCRDPSYTFGIDHLKAIHQVEVWAFNKSLFFVFKILLLLNHIEKQLGHLSFIINWHWSISDVSNSY